MSEEKFKDLPTGLYWKGKKTEVDRVVLPFQTIETINESRATREREKVKGKDLFKNENGGNWHNRLIWGDNKYIMASLLEEFAGKIDLIYIDPPFATGADFSVKMTLGDAEWTKEPSAIEDKAYRDTWGQGLDSYLQMMYERLVIMRELLSEKGAIYVHLDWHVGHYVKVFLDEIFGIKYFRNEIIWCYTGPSNQKSDFPDKHDVIYRYSKSDKPIFNIDDIRIPYDEKTMANYKKGLMGSGTLYSGEIKSDKGILDKKGKIPEDWWIMAASSRYPIDGVKRTGYATEKPWPLIERIIKASSNEGDLVADFFCGSGTTGAVAEKLGRRWVMADLGRYAIHTTRKRLLGIDNCKPFVVQNLGKYERQYWQGVTFKKRSDEQMPIYEYIRFILKLYNAEPLTGMLHIHGKKGKHFVHVGAVVAPVTLTEIKEAMDEVKQAGQKALDILGWEWEMGLHDVVEKTAKESGIHLRLLSIPRDVMDTRASEKGDVTFYELAYLEVEVTQTKSRAFKVKLKDFAIPNLDLIPQGVRDKIKKWSDYIDYWSVDWDWHEDTFHNMWQSYRTRKERKLELTSDAHKYENSGNHKLMVKVIDIFGNDTTHVIEVKS
ncbi:MAG: site-specific DNA-methyltransferase [Candidatus Marinimicrobia bacterium]|nr:site-specific DNA-methyltransferase [Candidatus Neomarinimicrobiota bacterium]